MRFDLDEVRAQNNDPITMMGEDPAPISLLPYQRCSLFWRPNMEFRIDAADQGHLWVGGYTPDTGKGMAFAHKVMGVYYDAQAVGEVLVEMQVKFMQTGPFMTGFAFHLNTFDDTFVAISRCTTHSTHHPLHHHPLHHPPPSPPPPTVTHYPTPPQPPPPPLLLGALWCEKASSECML